ncbi:MAG: hypothetical protein U0836_08785 [Pirellulales bacterium]
MSEPRPFLPRIRRVAAAILALLLLFVAGAVFFANDLVGLAVVAGIRSSVRRQDFAPQPAVRGSAISEPGRYVFPDSTELRVELVPHGNGHAVRYQLSRGEERHLVSTDNPSAFHRWALVLDAQNRLWFDSSDLGLSVWTMADGAWRQTTVGSARPDLLRAVPLELPLSGNLRAAVDEAKAATSKPDAPAE